METLKTFFHAIWMIRVIFSNLGVGHIDVIVAFPPDNAFMTFENETMAENITINWDEQKEITVECTAEGGNLSPEFNWYLGNQLFNGTFESRNESAKIVHKSIKNFNLSMHQNEEMLYCEVVHKGYNKQQLKNGINLIGTQLNLQFKANFLEPEKESGIVKLSFLCNPEPTGGQWIISEDLRIPFGTKNDTLEASDMIKMTDKNLYEVHLNYSLDGIQFVNLEVTNDLGTAVYLNIEIGSSGNLFVVVIIILLLLVIIIGTAYYFYIKKLYCFESKHSAALNDDSIEKGILLPGHGNDDEMDGSVKSNLLPLIPHSSTLETNCDLTLDEKENDSFDVSAKNSQKDDDIKTPENNLPVKDTSKEKKKQDDMSMKNLINDDDNNDLKKENPTNHSEINPEISKLPQKEIIPPSQPKSKTPIKEKVSPLSTIDHTQPNLPQSNIPELKTDAKTSDKPKLALDIKSANNWRSSTVEPETPIPGVAENGVSSPNELPINTDTAEIKDLPINTPQTAGSVDKLAGLMGNTLKIENSINEDPKELQPETEKSPRSRIEKSDSYESDVSMIYLPFSCLYIPF